MSMFPSSAGRRRNRFGLLRKRLRTCWLASANPELITAIYKVAKRPKGRVLVDYNQNAWGRTLASIYSIRPTPKETVSTPVTWQEVEKGITIEDFRVDNVRKRFAKV